MFKVASLNGNGANQTLLSMNNLVEGNIHGGIIDNTTGTKQNVTFIVGTVEFPLSVDANGTTPVSKINVPSDTTVQVNAPIGVNVSISYIETAADASAALTTIQGLVSEADTSATNAGISETNANNSAISANLSAENANESETNASNSEIMANKWAVNPEDTEVLTGQFSAYHWARKAQAVASGDVIDDGVVSDLLTWSSEKISEKIDEKTLNINNLPNKPTPDNTDNFALQEVGGDLKKVSYENLTKLSPNDSRVKTALNASGAAPIYACRAWVNFNGTGTVAIRASGNVSSITDNGVGNYTVNFTTAMVDANYSVATSSRQDNDANENAYDLRVGRVGLFSTTGVKVVHGYYTNVNVYVDCNYGLVSIFR